MEMDRGRFFSVTITSQVMLVPISDVGGVSYMLAFWLSEAGCVRVVLVVFIIPHCCSK